MTSHLVINLWVGWKESTGLSGNQRPVAPSLVPKDLGRIDQNLISFPDDHVLRISSVGKTQAG